jgi:uncharacterized membrane protein
LRRAAVVACLAALALAPGAAAKEFTLPAADVQVQVERDGGIAVTERIAFRFDGDFEGAFREIPLRPGESLDRVSVAEGGDEYVPGASAELGSFGVPGTYGTARTDKGFRIVWHYRASNELRTFEVRYRLSGLAVAHDDVVDVNLQVWGDEWQTGLGRLTAALALPGPASGPAYRIWGAPAYVRGVVGREPARATLEAVQVPPHQFVELRVLFPRSLLTSTARARVEPGAALQRIVAEQNADAADFAHGQAKIHEAVRHLPRTLLILFALGIGPAALLLFGVWLMLGRERKSDYDREYEQEPPSDLAPALVPTLLRQGGTVGSLEFTATLFDLIRRGRYESKPVTTERKTWGGLRHEAVSDLELSRGSGDSLTPYEQDVAEVVDSLVADGPERLSQFRDKILEDRKTNSTRFTSFKTHVGEAMSRLQWFESAGGKVLGAALAVSVVLAVVLLWVGIDGFRALAPRWSDVVLIALGVCAGLNAALLLVGLTRFRLWRRRRPEAEREAERWDAFRRYLTDFPRLADAPPASLELWERYLVYGIALGIAERVLQNAQLHMPEELHQASSIYWISPGGDLGGGASALAIGDLSSGFGSALTPPSSGGGGGFSGGGGGGGGGGAW